MSEMFQHILGGGKVAVHPKDPYSDMAIILREKKGAIIPWYIPENALIGLDFEENDYRIIEEL